MDPLLVALGLACVAWTAAELALAGSTRSRRSTPSGFGAVDAATGREVPITVDRRRRPRDRRS